jgi:arylsulfatase A-like enzyme
VDELAAFLRGASLAFRCATRQLTLGASASCQPWTVPPCAGNAIADALALAFGGDPTAPPFRDVPQLRDQARCQRVIARTSRKFLHRRVVERVGDLRRQRRSRHEFTRVLSRCAVTADVNGTAPLPALGAPCAHLTSPGSPLDPGRVVACLRPALERIVDGVAPAPLRPNIVLVNTDDQRADTLAYMPAVMRDVVAEGVAFSESFVTTSLCCPSRASLLTGRYAHNTGVIDNAGSRFDDRSTLATWLQDAGYATALFGKYLNGYRAFSPYVPPGWDEWQAFVDDTPLFYDYRLNENGTHRFHAASDATYSTDLLAARALDFVRAHAEEPFFLYFTPFAPHAPATPAARHLGSFAGLPPWRPPSYRQADLTGKPGWVFLQKFLAFSAAAPSEAARDLFRVRQLESLQAVDEAVAALVRTLGDLGLDDNTIVVFTSDNGHAWGEHWYYAKECPYEECLRVPLAIRYPVLVPRAGLDDRLVLNIDLAPTLAELAGAAVPAGVNGRSLVPILEGRGDPWREDFLFEHWYRSLVLIPTHAGVRTREWKYLEYEGSPPYVELYDLVNDPWELTNLAGDPLLAGVEAALAARLGPLRLE